MGSGERFLTDEELKQLTERFLGYSFGSNGKNSNNSTKIASSTSNEDPNLTVSQKGIDLGSKDVVLGKGRSLSSTHTNWRDRMPERG